MALTTQVCPECRNTIIVDRNEGKSILYGEPDMGMGNGNWGGKFHSHVWRPSLQYVCVWFAIGEYEMDMLANCG